MKRVFENFEVRTFVPSLFKDFPEAEQLKFVWRPLHRSEKRAYSKLVDANDVYVTFDFLMKSCIENVVGSPVAFSKNDEKQFDLFIDQFETPAGQEVLHEFIKHVSSEMSGKAGE